MKLDELRYVPITEVHYYQVADATPARYEDDEDSTHDWLRGSFRDTTILFFAETIKSDIFEISD